MSPLIPTFPPAPPKAAPWVFVALDATRTRTDLLRSELSFLFTGTSPNLGIDLTDLIALPSNEELLEEVKDRAGLTWEQVGRLLGVSRRSVHKWLRGETMASSNEERLHRLKELVVAAEAGNGFSTRNRLLDRTNGLSAFELFRSGRMEDALNVVAGHSTVADPFAVLRVPARQISQAARAARRGPKLADTLNTDPSQEGTPTAYLNPDEAVIPANSDGD